MNTLTGDITTLVEAIKEYERARKAVIHCNDAWESGDPCAMAENDPSDLYIKEVELDTARDAVVVCARNLAPWVTENYPLSVGTFSDLTRALDFAMTDHSEAKADHDCYVEMKCDDPTVTTKAVARVSRAWQDVLDAVQDIAEVQL